MNNQKYIVYVHTLRRDGRRYVGITRRTPKQRWHNGKNYSNNPYFYNDIKKYGWDAFEHEIIYTGLSKDEACEIEKRLIKQYKTQQHDYGFNVGNGGEGAESVSESTRRKMRRARLGVSPWNKGVKMSKEQRAALSKSRKENPSRYWLGKHRSNETKRKISERNKGKPAPNKGIQYGEEFRRKVSESHKGISPWNKGKEVEKTKVKIICLETGIIYDSVGSAAVKIGGKSNSISSVLTGYRKTYKRMHWEYYDENKDYSSSEYYLKQTYSRPKVKCIETGVVYNSSNEASKEIGLVGDSVLKVCKGERDKAGGLHWRFVDDDLFLAAENARKNREEKKNKIGRDVICIETGEIYKSAYDASKRTSGTASGIKKACEYQINTSGGYHWKYADCELDKKALLNKKHKIVYKVECLETGVVYQSAKEVFVKTGINQRNIQAACNGHKKSAGGFHWRYIIEREVD